MRFSNHLNPADAAVLETFVVPRYLSLFGDLVIEMLLVGEDARLAHLGCRTGYPNHEILAKFNVSSIVAVDGSAAALELAGAKAAAHPGEAIEYCRAEGLPVEIEGESCSHVVSLHPAGRAEDRGALYREAYRLLYEGGQLLVALPLRGSFQEVADLLREYALKYDDEGFGNRVERMMEQRPTIETLAEQLEEAGFDDVDVEIRATELVFDSGRAFVEDPITRLLVVPELMAELALDDLAQPLTYLRDAIDRYWSEHQFGLTLNVGCASARR